MLATTTTMAKYMVHTKRTLCAHTNTHNTPRNKGVKCDFNRHRRLVCIIRLSCAARIYTISLTGCAMHHHTLVDLNHRGNTTQLAFTHTQPIHIRGNGEQNAMQCLRDHALHICVVYQCCIDARATYIFRVPANPTSRVYIYASVSRTRSLAAVDTHSHI